MEDTPGYMAPYVYIYSQEVSIGPNAGGFSSATYEVPSMTLSNSIINKVTNIVLNNYDLTATGVTQIILEVEQTAFPNIGRGNNIACGSHLCSKFDKPIQYFILYPSSTLGATATLTFPNIATPPYSGSFRFDIRGFKSSYTQFKKYFFVGIDPETMTTTSYTFSPQTLVTTLFPNADHLYTIGWTTCNALVTSGGNAYILVTINNVFTLSSTYCHL